MNSKTGLFSTLLLVLIAAPSFLFSQNYIVTYKGDTLRGEVKLISYDQIDKVQLIQGREKTMYTALQVKALSMGGNTLQAVRYDNSIRMMKVLKSGYLSFYAFSTAGTMTWDGRYLAKKDGTGIEVPNLTFKKSLASFLKDCPELKDRLDAGEFSRKDLERIIDLYNTCLQTKTDNLNLTPARSTAHNLEIIQAIKDLSTKVEAENLLTKSDALDILKDIQNKVAKDQTVPNYLIEGLKSSLLDTPSLSKDLEKVLALLKK